ncbi:MAG: hypothetical protein H6695_02715 [Deferribacteres bacterium]|nr:hypothetical protein [candidate division KSB1 bacterium]MCB9509059.1 hypothetical protein [Deferribacteres bacterium]
MSRLAWFFLIFNLVESVAVKVWAQVQPPNVRPSNTVSFQQQLDVFDWRYLVGYGGLKKKFSYEFGIDFTTSMTDRSDGNRWKDNQIGYLGLSQRLHPNLLLLGRMQLTNFHDELSAFNFDRQQAAATIATNWHAFSRFYIQPELGYRWENRREFKEHGPFAALSFQADAFEIDGYRNQSSGLAEMTRFPERKNANARINYSVFREFQPGTSDSLAVFYDYFRRDNFFSNPTLGNIESLRKEQRGLSNTLRYRISDGVILAQNTMLALGNVAVQQFEQFRTGATRSHDDYSLTNDVQLFWQSNRFTGQIAMETSESSVKYNIPDSAGFSPISRRFATIGYDLAEKRTKLSQRTYYRPNKKNVLQFSLEVAKLQHDNSDTTNNDSFDEQRWQVALSHHYQLREALSIGVQISAFLKHFVYLDGGLSSQNNWTRLLILQPVLRYQPSSSVLFQQKVGVRTQYVDYDFEGNSSQVRSYVIRDFFLSDSLALPVSSQIDFSLFYRLELEELGSLNWSAFSTRPRTKLQNHWFNMLLSQSFRWPVELGIGASFYLQKRWQFISDSDGEFSTEPIGTQFNFGPIMRLVYRASDGSLIYFSGQRQKAYPFQGKPYFISHIQLSVQWTF